METVSASRLLPVVRDLMAICCIVLVLFEDESSLMNLQNSPPSRIHIRFPPSGDTGFHSDQLVKTVVHSSLNYLVISTDKHSSWRIPDKLFHAISSASSIQCLKIKRLQRDDELRIRFLVYGPMAGSGTRNLIRLYLKASFAQNVYALGRAMKYNNCAQLRTLFCIDAHRSVRPTRGFHEIIKHAGQLERLELRKGVSSELDLIRVCELLETTDCALRRMVQVWCHSRASFKRLVAAMEKHERRTLRYLEVYKNPSVLFTFAEVTFMGANILGQRFRNRRHSIGIR